MARPGMITLHICGGLTGCAGAGGGRAIISDRAGRDAKAIAWDIGHAATIAEAYMEFCIDRVLDHHVADHVAQYHEIYNFQLLGTFPCDGDPPNPAHHHNHTSQEIKKHMQAFCRIVGGPQLSHPQPPGQCGIRCCSQLVRFENDHEILY